MSQVFEGPTWSIEVPDGWTVRDEDEVTTFEADPPVGALQVSAYAKDGPVTDEDLKEFAEEHITAGATPDTIEHPIYDGFAISYEVDEQFWTEWYLRHENQMLYVTYTCAESDEGTEDETISGMLGSLLHTDGEFEYEEDDDDDEDDLVVDDEDDLADLDDD